jgi:hypothetical protein
VSSSHAGQQKRLSKFRATERNRGTTRRSARWSRYERTQTVAVVRRRHSDIENLADVLSADSDSGDRVLA